MTPEHAVPLAPFTTLGVGGAAARFTRATTEAELLRALAWADEAGQRVRLIGGGSNLVVADEGVDGLVVAAALTGLEISEGASGARIVAGAGESWDDVVRRSVERGLAGIEALSGIPGLAGATPIQNVGAYGQDVSQSITEVRVIDRTSGTVETLAADACGFAYRDSRLKSAEPDRFFVVSVTFELARRAPVIRYAELAHDLASRGIDAPDVAEVRRSVIALRRKKSMVIDPGDTNRRSCGSFFVNPVVDAGTADSVRERASGADVPRWDEPDGRVKLSAGWLIERAGFPRGLRDGNAGLSSKHALAIVAHDGATARDVVRLARRVRAGVEDRFGVRLIPEPVFWGFDALEDRLPI